MGVGHGRARDGSASFGALSCRLTASGSRAVRQ
jgi:hypothetical protein